MPSRVRWLALVTVFFASAHTLRAQERALVPLEVRPSPAFQAAVGSGTRSLEGTPGAGYWQQRADYTIEVAVEPRERRLTHAFRCAMLLHGVDLSGLGGMTTAAHTEDDVNQTVEAVSGAVELLRTEAAG